MQFADRDESPARSIACVSPGIEHARLTLFVWCRLLIGCGMETLGLSDVSFPPSHELACLLLSGLSWIVRQPISDFQSRTTRLSLPQCAGTNLHHQIGRRDVTSDSPFDEKPERHFLSRRSPTLAAL